MQSVSSITAAGGFTPGKDVAIAIDVASSHFYQDGKYIPGNEALDSRAMIGRISDWLDRYPIISVEDGLAEDDWGPLAAASRNARSVSGRLRCSTTICSVRTGASAHRAKAIQP